MITKQQAAEIEMLQKRVTRLCFGFDRSYMDACTDNNIESLERRRKKAANKFTRKTINNPRFAEKWLVPRPEIENNLELMICLKLYNDILTSVLCTRYLRFFGHTLLASQLIITELVLVFASSSVLLDKGYKKKIHEHREQQGQ